MAMTKPTSEQVTFLQTGTGATARTVDSKLKDIISVKDFGAVGDGVTNDTAAFTAAITAAGTKNVYVLGGSYAITGTITGSFYSDGVVTIVGGTVNTINRIGSVLSTTGTLTATNGVTAASLTSKIQPITASVGSNALTITLNPTILDFRSATISSGTVTSLVVENAISLTIPSGATLGTVNNVQSQIVVVAINYNGTVELAAVNIAGGQVRDETTPLSTTAVISGSNLDTVYYSTNARTSVAYRVVGYIESTQTTAGTWVATPTTIQGMGGQALTAMSSLGYGQTWQTVTRVNGTTYYNTTGKPIVACFQAILLPAAGMSFTINSQTSIATITNAQVSNQTMSTSAIIPVNASYINAVSGSTSANVFYELR